MILLFCSDKPGHIFGRVVEGLGTLGWKSHGVLRDQWEALWRKLDKDAENSADNGELACDVLESFKDSIRDF